MIKLATFGSWLDAQAGRGDEVGQVASAWRKAAGQRPRASAHPTITRWFASEPEGVVPGMDSGRIEAVLVAALAQYHTGSHQAGPAVPSPPLGPDLQPVRLASVPDHQQPGRPADGETVGQEPAVPTAILQDHGLSPGSVMEIAGRLESLDERLAGLQELVGFVPAIHELLVAFMQAMAPLMALAKDAEAAMDAQPVEPSTMAEQLGVSAAQQAAHAVAASNGWVPAQQQPDQPADDREPLDWAGGLCEIHCREDRCVYGCDCPGHLSDGSHVTQARNPGEFVQHYVQGGRAAGRTAAMGQQAADQGPRLLYGGHITPEPDWAHYHDLGEPGDG